MLSWLCAKPKTVTFGLIKWWFIRNCHNSVRIPLQNSLGLTSIILLAYMSSRLPGQGEGTTGVETPAFPSTDNLSWPDSHHFPLPYQNIESKALMIVSGFQVPGLWSILRSCEYKTTLDGKAIRLQGRHSWPTLLKQPKSLCTAEELPQS